MILVTGGGGFLGKALIQGFNERFREDRQNKAPMPLHGWTHYNYDLPNHSIIWPDPWSPQAGSLYKMACAHNNVEMVRDPIQGDLWDKVEKSKVVIHCAAVANLNESEKDKARNHRINVEGTYNVGMACAILKKPMIFISTCCGYGTTLQHFSASEESKPRPTEVYARSKIEAENLLLDMGGRTWKFWRRNGLRVKICRMGTMYGPGMRPELFNYIALKNCAEGKPIEIHGTGLQTRCYLYIKDAVKGIIAVMEKGLDGEIYNLAGGEPISLMVTTEVARQLTHKVPDIRFIEDRKGQIFVQKIDVSKAMALGWFPSKSYADGMKETWEWMRPAFDPEFEDFGK